MSVEKTIREHLGWSQDQLAFHLGVSCSLVKLVEAEMLQWRIECYQFAAEQAKKLAENV